MNRDRDQNETLDRIWAATRPEEPSADAFDRLWAKVSDRASQPEILPFTPAATWKRWSIALGVMAQAAVLLIAAILALRPTDRAQTVQIASLSSPAKGHQTTKPSAPVLHVYELALGTTIFVNLDGRGSVQEVKVQAQMPESDIDVVTAESDVLNFMESYE